MAINKQETGSSTQYGATYPTGKTTYNTYSSQYNKKMTPESEKAYLEITNPMEKALSYSADMTQLYNYGMRASDVKVQDMLYFTEFVNETSSGTQYSFEDSLNAYITMENQFGGDYKKYSPVQEIELYQQYVDISIKYGGMTEEEAANTYMEARELAKTQSNINQKSIKAQISSGSPYTTMLTGVPVTQIDPTGATFMNNTSGVQSPYGGYNEDDIAKIQEKTGGSIEYYITSAKAAQGDPEALYDMHEYEREQRNFLGDTINANGKLFDTAMFALNGMVGLVGTAVGRIGAGVRTWNDEGTTRQATIDEFWANSKEDWESFVGSRGVSYEGVTQMLFQTEAQQGMADWVDEHWLVDFGLNVALDPTMWIAVVAPGGLAAKSASTVAKAAKKTSKGSDVLSASIGSATKLDGKGNGSIKEFTKNVGNVKKSRESILKEKDTLVNVIAKDKEKMTKLIDETNTKLLDGAVDENGNAINVSSIKESLANQNTTVMDSTARFTYQKLNPMTKSKVKKNINNINKYTINIEAAESVIENLDTVLKGMDEFIAFGEETIEKVSKTEAFNLQKEYDISIKTINDLGVEIENIRSDLGVMDIAFKENVDKISTLKNDFANATGQPFDNMTINEWLRVEELSDESITKLQEIQKLEQNNSKKLADTKTMLNEHATMLNSMEKALDRNKTIDQMLGDNEKYNKISFKSEEKFKEIKSSLNASTVLQNGAKASNKAKVTKDFNKLVRQKYGKENPEYAEHLIKNTKNYDKKMDFIMKDELSKLGYNKVDGNTDYVEAVHEYKYGEYVPVDFTDMENRLREISRKYGATPENTEDLISTFKNEMGVLNELEYSIGVNNWLKKINKTMYKGNNNMASVMNELLGPGGLSDLIDIQERAELFGEVPERGFVSALDDISLMVEMPSSLKKDFVRKRVNVSDGLENINSNIMTQVGKMQNPMLNDMGRASIMHDGIVKAIGQDNARLLSTYRISLNNNSMHNLSKEELHKIILGDGTSSILTRNDEFVKLAEMFNTKLETNPKIANESIPLLSKQKHAFGIDKNGKIFFGKHSEEKYGQTYNNGNPIFSELREDTYNILNENGDVIGVVDDKKVTMNPRNTKELETILNDFKAVVHTDGKTELGSFIELDLSGVKAGRQSEHFSAVAETWEESVNEFVKNYGIGKELPFNLDEIKSMIEGVGVGGNNKLTFTNNIESTFMKEILNTLQNLETYDTSKITKLQDELDKLSAKHDNVISDYDATKKRVDELEKEYYFNLLDNSKRAINYNGSHLESKIDNIEAKVDSTIKNLEKQYGVTSTGQLSKKISVDNQALIDGKLKEIEQLKGKVDTEATSKLQEEIKQIKTSDTQQFNELKKNYNFLKKNKGALSDIKPQSVESLTYLKTLDTANSLDVMLTNIRSEGTNVADFKAKFDDIIKDLKYKTETIGLDRAEYDKKSKDLEDLNVEINKIEKQIVDKEQLLKYEESLSNKTLDKTLYKKDLDVDSEQFKKLNKIKTSVKVQNLNGDNVGEFVLPKDYDKRVSEITVKQGLGNKLSIEDEEFLAKVNEYEIFAQSVKGGSLQDVLELDFSKLDKENLESVKETILEQMDNIYTKTFEEASGKTIKVPLNKGHLYKESLDIIDAVKQSAEQILSPEIVQEYIHVMDDIFAKTSMTYHDTVHTLVGSDDYNRSKAAEIEGALGSNRKNKNDLNVRNMNAILNGGIGNEFLQPDIGFRNVFTDELRQHNATRNRKEKLEQDYIDSYIMNTYESGVVKEQLAEEIVLRTTRTINGSDNLDDIINKIAENGASLGVGNYGEEFADSVFDDVVNILNARGVGESEKLEGFKLTKKMQQMLSVENIDSKAFGVYQQGVRNRTVKGSVDLANHSLSKYIQETTGKVIDTPFETDAVKYLNEINHFSTQDAIKEAMVIKFPELIQGFVQTTPGGAKKSKSKQLKGINRFKSTRQMEVPWSQISNTQHGMFRVLTHDQESAITSTIQEEMIKRGYNGNINEMSVLINTNDYHALQNTFNLFGQLNDPNKFTKIMQDTTRLLKGSALWGMFSTKFAMSVPFMTGFLDGQSITQTINDIVGFNKNQTLFFNKINSNPAMNDVFNEVVQMDFDEAIPFIENATNLSTGEKNMFTNYLFENFARSHSNNMRAKYITRKGEKLTSQRLGKEQPKKDWIDHVTKFGSSKPIMKHMVANFDPMEIGVLSRAKTLYNNEKLLTRKADEAGIKLDRQSPSSKMNAAVKIAEEELGIGENLTINKNGLLNNIVLFPSFLMRSLPKMMMNYFGSPKQLYRSYQLMRFFDKSKYASGYNQYQVANMGAKERASLYFNIPGQSGNKALRLNTFNPLDLLVTISDYKNAGNAAQWFVNMLNPLLLAPLEFITGQELDSYGQYLQSQGGSPLDVIFDQEGNINQDTSATEKVAATMQYALLTVSGTFGRITQQVTNIFQGKDNYGNAYVKPGANDYAIAVQNAFRKEFGLDPLKPITIGDIPLLNSILKSETLPTMTQSVQSVNNSFHYKFQTAYEANLAAGTPIGQTIAKIENKLYTASKAYILYDTAIKAGESGKVERSEPIKKQQEIIPPKDQIDMLIQKIKQQDA